jgi:hypothetical protein
MRMLNIAIATVFLTSAGSAYAVNPAAENASGLVLHSTLSSITGENSGIAMPSGEVQPGATFVITGDCVMRTGSVDNLRVVLTFADMAAGTPGYRAVVATDQEIDSNGLSVRVPDLPEAANRIFSVKVFRLGEETPQVCSAGNIRIGHAPVGKLG